MMISLSLAARQQRQHRQQRQQAATAGSDSDSKTLPFVCALSLFTFEPWPDLLARLLSAAQKWQTTKMQSQRERERGREEARISGNVAVDVADAIWRLLSLDLVRCQTLPVSQAASSHPLPLTVPPSALAVSVADSAPDRHLDSTFQHWSRSR